jgi:AmiR/NasT family two-component response regulator
VYRGELLSGDHLRVLIANEQTPRLALITQMVTSIGHTVITASAEVADVGVLTARERPDVALVGLGESSQRALDLIGRIVRQATCPVIALLEGHDCAFVDQAAKRGVFAHLVDTDAHELQGALDITLSRFTEYHNLQGAFGRRAIIERAKGILMERHQIDEQPAFVLLRDQARHFGRKLVDIAQAIVDGHALLPANPNDTRAEPPRLGEHAETSGAERSAARRSSFASVERVWPIHDRA